MKFISLTAEGFAPTAAKPLGNGATSKLQGKQHAPIQPRKRPDAQRDP
jgi:hypothetical protein